MHFIVVRVVLGDRVGGGGRESVVIRNVGGEATEEGRLASVAIELSEELGSRAQVGGPAEPAGVTSVEVHVDTDGVELLNSVDNALLVGALGTAALGDVQVSDQVRERVRFDDSNNADVRVLWWQ